MKRSIPQTFGLLPIGNKVRSFGKFQFPKLAFRFIVGILAKPGFHLGHTLREFCIIFLERLDLGFEVKDFSLLTKGICLTFRKWHDKQQKSLWPTGEVLQNPFQGWSKDRVIS